MRLGLASALLPLVLGLSGCVFQNLSSAERLRDAVVGYNDECRWGRIDLAAQRVAAPIRERFRLTHHNWGRAFQIADSEIVHVETAGEENETAVSTVIVRWYDQRTMILADTTLRQRWEKVRGGYVLIGEEAVAGNLGLLEIPAELLPESEEGDGDGEAESGEARASL